MITTTTRRTLLRWLPALGAFAAPAATAATITPTPITSPAEYLREMQAIGWRAVAGNFRGKPSGVIEYAPESAKKSFEGMAPFWQLQRRIPDGGDFWKRTARYLFDLGLREVGPARKVAEQVQS